MRDMFAIYSDSGEMPTDHDENPFFDNPEPVMIGEGYYKLEPLSYFIDNPATVNLIGPTYEIHGKIEVDIIPCTPNGCEDPDEIDLIPDDPEDLIDQRIDFNMKIKQITDLPQDLCRDTYVEYQFYLDQTKYKTKVVEGRERNPVYDYSHQHTVETVTDNLVKYLKEKCVTFRVYGFADVKEKK